MGDSNLLTINQIQYSENRYIKKNSFNKLINKAGSKIVDYIEQNIGNKKILFVCGPGNNGLDGELAFKKLSKKTNTQIFQLKKHRKIQLNKFQNLINANEIIFDCIFGIGLNRSISGDLEKVIKIINKSDKKIISIDIPSGLNSDSGNEMGLSVKANVTLAMGFLKPGYYLMPGKELVGKLELLSLGLEHSEKMKPEIKLIRKKFFKFNMPNHKLGINKYDKGHVLIFGGKMAGASRLAAFSARKVGCGLSTIATTESNLKYYTKTEPGTIVKIFNRADLKRKDVLVVGPGLGKKFKKDKLLDILNFFSGPIVLDADAISLFENHKKEFVNFFKKKDNVIMTPHLGEFKRVFNYSCNQSKFYNCLEASKLINNCVLLKGNDSVITFPNEKVWINNLARNNLATAGSGDVLCGIIAGLLAQKMKIENAMLASLWIQNKISQSHEHVVVEDFLNQIPIVMNSLKKK